MIIPTGIPEKQALTLVEKTAKGAVSTRDILAVRFSELEEPGQFAGIA
jgi:protein-L-isoaspartate O-methyltransferase